MMERNAASHRTPASAMTSRGTIICIRRGLFILCALALFCLVVTLPYAGLIDSRQVADNDLVAIHVTDRMKSLEKKVETLQSLQDMIKALNTSQEGMTKELSSLRNRISNSEHVFQGLSIRPQQPSSLNEDFTSPLPSLIGNQVFLLDVVWVSSESKLVMLALAPKMFHSFPNTKTDFAQRHSSAYNLTFSYEELKSPMTLVAQLSWDQKPVRSCRQVEAKANDGNINKRLFIVHCQVDSTARNMVHSLRYQGAEVARFDSKHSTFNAAKSMVFHRISHKNSAGEATLSNSTRLSILIKPLSNYSPLFPDLIDYYWRQGVRHVYVGLIRPDKEMYDSYHRILEKFPGFVSFGWFNSTDVGFKYSMKTGHILLKVMFANSVLYHSRASDDDLLMVVDIDEAPVNMEDTRTSFVDVMSAQIDNETCSGVVRAHNLWRIGDEYSTRIGERFPVRCSALSGPEKSVAVVRNCQFVGIHGHGACVKGTRIKELDSSQVAIHHYTAWWTVRYRDRYRCNGPQVESELAKYQREALLSDR